MIEPPPLPREHGAWVLLAIPLVLGLAIAYRRPAGWLVALAVLAAFLAHYALVPALARARVGKAAPEAWLRRRWTWGAAYACVSALSCAAALVLAPRPTRAAAIALVCACGAGAGLYFRAAVLDRGRALWSELIGIAGMALAAALVCAVSGVLDIRASSAVVLAYAYALSSIAFVRAYEVRGAERRRAVRLCTRSHIAIASGLVVLWLTGVIAGWTIAALAPALLRTIIGLGRPQENLRAVGRRELLVAASLVTIAIVSLLRVDGRP